MLSWKPVSKTPTMTSWPYASCNGEAASLAVLVLLIIGRPKKSQLLVVCNCIVLLLKTDITPSISAII